MIFVHLLCAGRCNSERRRRCNRRRIRINNRARRQRQVEFVFGHFVHLCFVVDDAHLNRWVEYALCWRLGDCCCGRILELLLSLHFTVFDTNCRHIGRNGCNSEKLAKCMMLRDQRIRIIIVLMRAGKCMMRVNGRVQYLLRQDFIDVLEVRTKKDHTQIEQIKIHY